MGEIAESMELRSIIRYHKGRSINLSTLEGNAFEAIMGAIYLDGGFDQVKSSVYNHIFRKYMDLHRILEEEIDFKSKLFKKVILSSQLSCNSNISLNLLPRQI